MKVFIKPALWVLVFQAVSALIGYVTSQNMGWYRGLEKAAFNPPDIAFPIVWTSLYVMLAICGWLVCEKRKRSDADMRVFVLFWVQMLLNWAWSFVFFAFHLIIGGFVWILALDLAMIAFVIAAWRHNRVAAVLMIPTILWGSFAASLNYMIWILN